MFLVAGLGNPGRKYESTRHNIGFDIADKLALTLGLERWKKGFSGLYCETHINGEKVLILKPGTYMNRSGDSVAGAAGFFKVPPDSIIVVHDELDLPIGRIRVKSGGGSAGHKGIDSIIERLGSRDFSRVRVGIGKPVQGADVVGHVLSGFSGTERELLDEVAGRSVEAVMEIMKGGVESAMNKFNTKPKQDEDPALENNT